MQENKWSTQQQHLLSMTHQTLPHQSLPQPMTSLHSTNEGFTNSCSYGEQTQTVPAGNLSTQHSQQIGSPMFLAPLPQKPEWDHSRTSYQNFLPSFPVHPSASRPLDVSKDRLSAPHFDRKYSLDSSMASFSYGPPTFQPTLRKRRTESMCSPNEAGPLFAQTKQQRNLYSLDRTNSYIVRVDCKFDRGFFLADNDWTCYRRNYFQVSGAFTLIGSNHPPTDPECPCLIEVGGVYHTVKHFRMRAFAKVSNSDKRIDLIQHTPKRDKGPQNVPTAKIIRAGGNVHLSSIGSNQTIVTFERIQFKTATANNGKRRAAQQYYVVVIELLAECDNGETYQVATAQSAPLVVRGRSPGHYADNNERFGNLNPNSPPDEKYYPHHRLSSDLGSSYSVPSSFTPYPSLPSSQMMMTPSTPNSGNSCQNSSPYLMHGLSESGNATPEIFSSGIGPEVNSSGHSPIVNQPGSPSHLQQGQPLPRMNQTPIGLNIYNIHCQEDLPRSRLDSYHSGTTYGTDENQEYQQSNGMTNAGFSGYEQEGLKVSTKVMTQDRFNNSDGMSYPQIIGTSYQPQDYSHHAHWANYHSNGYQHEINRPASSQQLNRPYTYPTHESK